MHTAKVFVELLEGTLVRATARIAEVLDGREVIHAEPGDFGRVVGLGCDHYPTVTFLRSGTTTDCTPDEFEVHELDPEPPTLRVRYASCRGCAGTGVVVDTAQRKGVCPTCKGFTREVFPLDPPFTRATV